MPSKINPRRRPFGRDPAILVREVNRVGLQLRILRRQHRKRVVRSDEQRKTSQRTLHVRQLPAFHINLEHVKFDHLVRVASVPVVAVAEEIDPLRGRPVGAEARDHVAHHNQYVVVWAYEVFGVEAPVYVGPLFLSSPTWPVVDWMRKPKLLIVWNIPPDSWGEWVPQVQTFQYCVELRDAEEEAVSTRIDEILVVLLV